MCFSALFVIYFVHNVSAIVSYNRKELLDIRTAITHLVLDEDFFFNEAAAKDIIQTPDKAQIPIICKRKRQRYWGRRSGCLVRIRRRASKLPLPSSLLANVQSLENKLDDLRLRLSYQRDIKNCNILCFTESWLNDDMDNIQLAGYTLHRQDRTADSGKTRGGGLCIFVNNSWCTECQV